MSSATRITMSLLAIAVSAVVVGTLLSAPARARIGAMMKPSVRHQADPRAARVRSRLLPPGITFGSPLPGLTAQQSLEFAAGLDEFVNEEDVEGGLGPIFNDVSCVAWHSVPAVGGSSTVTVTRFGLHGSGGFDPLESLGGSLLQHSAIDPGALEVVPGLANIVIKRESTPLFGLGLIEAIPEGAILDNAARQPISIRGVPSVVSDVATGQTRVGRFGWKGQQATLLSFAGDAYLNEMGVTSRLFPTENAPNGNLAKLALYDTVMDPEDTVDPATGKGDIDHAADFMRLLAPPPVLALNAQSSRGAQAFGASGCAGCHTPRMTTGPDRINALSRRSVNLYSDLLLHDMGALGDGIVQGTASGKQMKTPPLWGLRASAPYLHDGRAATVDQAILAHDGQGAGSREAYKRLSPAQKAELLAFLNSI